MVLDFSQNMYNYSAMALTAYTSHYIVAKVLTPTWLYNYCKFVGDLWTELGEILLVVEMGRHCPR